MKRTIIYLICIVPLFGGCLDIKLDNQFSDPDAITTVATARELLATAYNTLPRYQYELAVLSDDFYRTNYTKQDAEIQNLISLAGQCADKLLRADLERVLPYGCIHKRLAAACGQCGDRRS